MSTLEALLPLFEPETLARLTSKKAFAAGQELVAAGRTVTDIVFDGGHLRGKVKGTHPMPHQTGLKMLADGTLEASCSCPTHTDGWERICQHAVALALTLRTQYQTGADITRTKNPWVQDLGSSSSASNQQRYQVEVRKGHWHVMVFKGGGTPVIGRKRYEGMSAADRLISHYLDQEVDDSDDGGHVIDDAAFAGMLYFGRGSTIGLKGVGKLQFGPEPLVLRIRAEPRSKDASVELHAFLEQRSIGRTIEVNSGRVIVGAPTWFLVPETAEVFQVPDTPPWVLELVGKQPRIVMDARVSAQQMDALSETLHAAGGAAAGPVRAGVGLAADRSAGGQRGGRAEQDQDQPGGALQQRDAGGVRQRPGVAALLDQPRRPGPHLLPRSRGRGGGAPDP